MLAHDVVLKERRRSSGTSRSSRNRFLATEGDGTATSAGSGSSAGWLLLLSLLAVDGIASRVAGGSAGDGGEQEQAALGGVDVLALGTASSSEVMMLVELVILRRNFLFRRV